MLSIREYSNDCKRPPSRNRGIKPERSGHDEKCGVYWPSGGRTFDDMRRKASERCWRMSPNVPGLSLVKRTILAAYVWGTIRTTTAQRLIDRTKSWEA